jgi:hypothetical protein
MEITTVARILANAIALFGEPQPALYIGFYSHTCT